MYAFITKEYYDSVFDGVDIPDTEFNKIAEAASEIVRATANQEIMGRDHENPHLKRATAYQVEYLYEHGGLDAIVGFATDGASSEMLGDYQINTSEDTRVKTPTMNGIPVSPLAIMALREGGFMRRCVYARRHGHHGR